MTHMTPEEKDLWNTCIAFHGHVCAGLLVGFKAAMYAIRLLDLDLYADEELACICETDTCSVDAIQVVLGCSTGGGNLFFHLTGKQAFTFFDRRTDRSVRLVLRPAAAETREEFLEYLNGKPPEVLFEVKKPVLKLPVIHRTLSKAVCSVCGEETDQEMLCLKNGRLICRDCSERPDRFHI